MQSTEFHIRAYLNIMSGLADVNKLPQDRWDWLTAEAVRLLELMGPSMEELQEQARQIEGPVAHGEDRDSLNHGATPSPWHKDSEPSPMPMREGDRDVVSRALMEPGRVEAIEQAEEDKVRKFLAEETYER